MNKVLLGFLSLISFHFFIASNISFANDLDIPNDLDTKLKIIEIGCDVEQEVEVEEECNRRGKEGIENSYDTLNLLHHVCRTPETFWTGTTKCFRKTIQFLDNKFLTEMANNCLTRNLYVKEARCYIEMFSNLLDSK